MKIPAIRNAMLILLVLCFFHCPYESEIPLSEPNEPIDRALLGSWKAMNKEDLTFRFLAFSEREYRIEITGMDDGKERKEKIRAYITGVDGDRFINFEGSFNDSNPNFRKFVFLDYRIENELLKLRLVSGDGIKIKFGAPELQREYFRAHKGDANFFESDWTILKRLVE